MKIAFVVPHLSTGGMPQYLNNKIEKLKETCEVWILEKNHEKTYNTVRLRIESQIGQDRIITWGQNPVKNFSDFLMQLDPDVIHFEEPCEQFVPEHVLEFVFRKDRRHKIFETLHDSTIEIQEKRFLPDKFLVVSPWQVYLLQDLGIPIEVIEHQIPEKTSVDKNGSQRLLGFDSGKKHVIQVGIFTPRKNQRETIELAKSFPEVQFHFIGTLAENYKHYWEPITKNLPSNCKIWGERNDVDVFYQAADLVILPSLPLFNDKETSPLVIKEAIAWGTPLLLRNLSVYVDMFQESNKIRFMGETHEQTVKIMSQILQEEFSLHQNRVFELKFSEEDNKINFSYQGQENLGKVFFSVKDRDSNTCIYGFDAEMSPGTNYWCIPIPKSYFDFSGNRNFTGFKVEVYRDKKDQKPFYVDYIEIKKAIRKKVIPSYPALNFEPIFVNYTQFFVEWIYNGFFAGSRIKSAIDVGASVGLFTEWVLDRFGSDCEIIAVEPNLKAADSFKFLHDGKNNVRLEELAVCDVSGEILEMKINPDNSLISSLEGGEGQYTEIQKVETITLIDLLHKHDWSECDLLKVDVEGAEYDIFKNFETVDFRKFKFLLIEFHNSKGRAKRLISKIREAGFRIDIRDDDTRYEVTEDNDRGTIFAIRLD